MVMIKTHRNKLNILLMNQDIIENLFYKVKISFKKISRHYR